MPQSQFQAPDSALGVNAPLKTLDRNPFRNPTFLESHLPAQANGANPFAVLASTQADTSEPANTSAGQQYEENVANEQAYRRRAYGLGMTTETAGNVFTGINYGHVTQIEELSMLRNLPIHPDISSHLSDYFPDSRANDEAHILQWIDSYDLPELVLCVLGKVGVGKSTLAKHLATRLREDQRCAAEVFFGFALPDWTVESIIRMIAGQLCGTYPTLTRAVCEAIRLDVNPSVSLETRIRKLILEPIRSLGCPRPLVILLDALDQWTPHPVLTKALACLATETHLIRFIIFGRPGLEDHFQNVSMKKYNLRDVVGSVMGEYLMERFSQVQWEYGRRPSAQTIDQLVERANGLFIWSSTVCSLLEDELSCPHPHDTLMAILQSQHGIGDSDILANLYHNAIHLRFLTPDHRAKLRVFLGAALALQAPLPVAAFASLVSMAAPTIRKILVNLLPLQTGQMKYDQDMVYPASLNFHLSILEYLQSSGTPPHLAFPIDIPVSHSQLGICCLEELRRVLSSPPSTFTTPLQKYALRYWPTHTAHGTPAVSPSSDIEWKATPHCAILHSLSILQWKHWATSYLQITLPGAVLHSNDKPAHKASGTQSHDSPQQLISHVVRSMLQPLANSAGIQDAIALLEMSVRLEHQNSEAWFELGSAYNNAAQIDASSGLLESAVRACRCAAAIGGDEGYRVPAMLAKCLHERFGRFGSREDLDKAISLRRLVLLSTPPGHPDRVFSFNTLATCLWSHFDRTGSAESLDEAIRLLHQALSLCPPDHPGRASSLNNLASTLQSHLELTGARESLEKAIVLHREALLLRPRGHPDRASSLNNLANTLQTHFESTGVAESQDEAIALHREALLLRPSGHPQRAWSLSNLAYPLRSHFQRTGTTKSLDEAIVLLQEALLLRPPGHPDRGSSLSNLARTLQSHSKLTGAVESLDTAIELHREALSLRSPGSPYRAFCLNNLAYSLEAHFKQTSGAESLIEAITLHREALSLRPSGHPDRVWSLNNLAHSLRSHFELTGTVKSLDEAIVLLREALSLRPSGHPDRSAPLNNLVSTLQASYKLTGNIQTLKEAMSLLPSAPDNAR